MKHFHKCGFPNEQGCGCIWQHDEKEFGLFDSESAHTCPQCGKKTSVQIDGETYTLKYHEYTAKQAGVPYEHPDERTCTTWPPLPSSHPERTTGATYADPRDTEKLVQDIERTFVCMVRVLGGYRPL